MPLKSFWGKLPFNFHMEGYYLIIWSDIEDGLVGGLEIGSCSISSVSIILSFLLQGECHHSCQSSLQLSNQ